MIWDLRFDPAAGRGRHFTFGMEMSARWARWCLRGLFLGTRLLGAGGGFGFAKLAVAGCEVGEHGPVDVLLDLDHGHARDLHLQVQDIQLVLRAIAFLDCRVEF